MIKVFYDPVNQVEIYNLEGDKTLAGVIANEGMDASSQEVELDGTEAHEVVGNNLQKYNYYERHQTNLAAQEASRVGKETSTKAKLGMSDQEWDDLKIALKLE